MTADAQGLLRSWSAPLGINLALCIFVLVYARGWFRLRIAFPNLLSIWRLAAFLGGIVSIWIAIGSPLEALDDLSLSVHMVQHLLLMAIAPALILLGAPVVPLLRGLPRSMTRNTVSPFLRWAPIKWLSGFVTHPAFCWLAAMFALIGWHVPVVFGLALRWDWLHELEHACFFGTGLLFWWPVVQPWPSIARWPRWSIPLYLFSATLPCDVLSAFLTFCDRVVYSSYLSAPRVFGIAPLQDQECAAALMWVCVTVIFLVPAVIVTLEILSPQRVYLPEETWPGLQRMPGRPLEGSKLEVI
jgi:cytochrome c oxidase assembly factor CtaG